MLLDLLTCKNNWTEINKNIHNNLEMLVNVIQTHPVSDSFDNQQSLGQSLINKASNGETPPGVLNKTTSLGSVECDSGASGHQSCYH